MDRPVDQSAQGQRSLRSTALTAIDDTRWVPERSKNRILSMVEGRPDWVISRKRAWGVPIALYVNRKTGDYLRDPAVNARILDRSEEHTSELQSLMRISYDVFCLKKKTNLVY